MTLRYIWEHNGNDTFVYAQDVPGACQGRMSSPLNRIDIPRYHF